VVVIFKMETFGACVWREFRTWRAIDAEPVTRASRKADEMRNRVLLVSAESGGSAKGKFADKRTKFGRRQWCPQVRRRCMYAKMLMLSPV
jgi:hypothetical protein